MMRVVTWNIWWRFGPWEARAPGIETTLRRLDADVICLQEVWATTERGQADELAAALGYHVVSSADGSDRNLLGNAILSRWPILDRAIVALPLGGGGPGHRTAVRARIDAPFGPAEVFCTHLAYQFDESSLRQHQIAEICRFVADTRDNPETDFPPVLCGDLNAVPTSDEIRSVTGEAPPPVPGLVFTDAWAAVGRGPGPTWDDRNPHLRGTSWPRRRLDYVLVGHPRPRPFGNPVRARRAGARSHGGVWPSDHLAVVVDLCTDRPEEHR